MRQLDLFFWACACAMMGLVQAQEIAYVTSLMDFQQALNHSAAHIVIGTHLDLRNATALPGNMTLDAGVAANWWSTKSIRGNCTGIPDPYPLSVPRTTKAQCVVTVSDDFLENEGQLWISDLYVSLQRQSGVLNEATVFANRGDLVLSNVVVSGGGAFARAIDVEYPQTAQLLQQAPWLEGRRARLLAEDCVLDGFFQDRHTAVRLSPNATGTFHRVTFSNSRTAAAPAAAGPALGLRTTLDDEAVLQRAAAWLRDCVFFNNTSPNPPPVSQQAESRVYVSELSAAPGAVWDETSRVVALPWVLRAYSEPELQPPAPATSVLFDVAAEGFISGGEPWLRGAIREQAAATGMAVGTVSQLDTALLAIPPPAPFSGTAQPLGAAVSADPPVAPVAPEGMSDEDIALIGVALGLGVLVLLVGVIAALLTIRHHFVHLEEQRRQGAERDKGPHASWQRHGSKHSDLSASRTPPAPPTPGGGSHQGPPTPSSAHHPWSPVSPSNTFAPGPPLAQWQSWGSNPNLSQTSSTPGSPLHAASTHAASSASSTQHVYQGRPHSGPHHVMYRTGSGGPGEGGLGQLVKRPHTIAEESSSFVHSARGSGAGTAGVRPPWPLEALHVPERPTSAQSAGSRASAKFKPAPETAAADAATQLDARALAQESAAAIAAAMSAAAPVSAPGGRTTGAAGAAGPAAAMVGRRPVTFGAGDVAGRIGTSSLTGGESSPAHHYRRHRPLSWQHAADCGSVHDVPVPRAHPRSPPAAALRNDSAQSLRGPSPEQRQDSPQARRGRRPEQHAVRAVDPRAEDWEMAHNSALIMIMEAHAQAMRASPKAGTPEAPFSLDQKLPHDSRKFARKPDALSTTDESGAERSEAGSGGQHAPRAAGTTGDGTTGQTNTATLALPAVSTTLGTGSHGSGPRYSSVTLPQFVPAAGGTGGGSGGGTDGEESSKMLVFGLPRRRRSSSAAAHSARGAAGDSAAEEASEARPLTQSLSLGGGYSLLQPQSMVQSVDQSPQRAERAGDGSVGRAYSSLHGPPGSMARSLASIHTNETWDDLGLSGPKRMSMLAGLPQTAAAVGAVDGAAESPAAGSPQSSLSALSSPDDHKHDATVPQRLSPRYPPPEAPDAHPRRGDSQARQTWHALSAGAVDGEVPQTQGAEAVPPHGARAGGGLDTIDTDSRGPEDPRDAGSLSDSGFVDEERSDTLRWPPHNAAGGSTEGVNAWIMHAERAFRRHGGSGRSGGSSRSWSRSSGLAAGRQPPRRFRGMHVADTSRDLEGIVERMHGNAPLAPPRHVILADSASVDGGGGFEGYDTTRSVSDTGRLSGDSAAKVLVGPWGVSAEGDSARFQPPELAGGWNAGALSGEENGDASATLYRVGASPDGGGGSSSTWSPSRSPAARPPQRRSPGQRSPTPPLDGRPEWQRGPQWSAALQSVPEGHGAEGMPSSDDGGTLSGVRTTASRPVSQPTASPKSPVPPLPSLPPAGDSGEWPHAGPGSSRVAGESLLTARGLLAPNDTVGEPEVGWEGETRAEPAGDDEPLSPRPLPTLDSPHAVPPPPRPKPLLPLPSPHPLNAPQSQSPRRGGGHPPPPHSQPQPLQPQSQPPEPRPATLHPRQAAAAPTALWSMLTGSSGSLDASCEILADRLAELAAETPTPLLFGRVQLIEDTEPRVSRQGVVAFAERLHRDGDPPSSPMHAAGGSPSRRHRGDTWQPVAVKFYLEESGFDRCRAVAHDAALRSSGAKALLDIVPRIGDLPAAAVVAKGMNMVEWARRQAERQRSDSGSIAAAGLLRPPTRKALAALAEIAEAMHAMHSCGWICGALKPSNIAWCPTLSAWAVIDFSYATRIGSPVCSTSTINYAPPEIISSAAEGQPRCAAAAAMDVWAFGVLAYEVILGRRAFPFAADARAVRDAVLGRKDAPWEVRRLADGSQRLRRAQGVIEACLRRDPEQRPPAAAVASAMRAMREEFPSRKLEERMPCAPTSAGP